MVCLGLKPGVAGLFKQIIQILQQINVKQCPSSIRRWNLNPQALKHELSPITARPNFQNLKYHQLCQYI